MIRVVTVGGEGHDHLKILRTLATGEKSLLSNNHTLPLLAEFQLEDITFCVFPKAAETAHRAYEATKTMNSVGDILDMYMQMLEVRTFYVISSLGSDLSLKKRHLSSSMT